MTPTEQPPRNWVTTYGCGNVITVVNASYVGSEGPCDMCRAIFDGTDDVYEPTGMVNRHLGWCQCGNPELTDQFMVDYLSTGGADRVLNPIGPVHTLMAYIADDLGWTEHGDSVRAAWLTDNGREALANLVAGLIAGGHQ